MWVVYIDKSYTKNLLHYYTSSVLFQGNSKKKNTKQQTPTTNKTVKHENEL